MTPTFEKVHDRVHAGRQMIRFGLQVVAYMPPTWNHPRAGKIPLRDPSTDSGRWILRYPDQLERAVRRVPDMNLAVLGLVVVDTDNAAAVTKAGDLGVTSDAPAWILRSRKGWHVLYRPAGRLLEDYQAHLEDRKPRRDAYVSVTKNGAPSAEPLVELDLIMPHTPAIIPPSVHKTGHVYRWAPGHSPTDIPFHELAEPPALLLEHWANLCRPKTPTSSRQMLGQPGTLEAAVRQLLEPRTKHGSFRTENSKGWIDEISCVYEDRHAGGDRHPSASVNFRIGVYKCWSCAAVTSLRRLAEEFNLSTNTISERRGQISVRSPWIGSAS